MTMTSASKASSFAFALAALCCAAACANSTEPGPPVHNPNFQQWTPSHPERWEVSGVTSRVGTWHEDDYGVQLVSDGSRISQLDTTLESSQAPCFQFSLVAKIARGAKAFLELDFLDDGAIEFSAQLPVSDWERRTFLITPPIAWQGVRFTVRKEGSGQVILAELAVQIAQSGCTMPPLPLLNRPNGNACDSDDDCAGHICFDARCAGCASDGDCMSGELCGDTVQEGVLVQACSAIGSGKFGAICSVDAQCDSGLCVDGACSECSDLECGDGERCARVAPDQMFHITTNLPHLCSPGSRRRESGELCTVHEDCKSLNCAGSLVTCVAGCRSLTEPGCAQNCSVVEQTGGVCR
jgi:hypothetical protein